MEKQSADPQVTASAKLSAGSTTQNAGMLWVLAWLVNGFAMILFNKSMFTTWNFPYPFALTLWHCVFATVVTQVMVRFPKLTPEKWGLFESAKEGKITRSMLLTRLLPLSLFFALGLVLGISAYKYLSVAYIQMLKSLSPVCILLVAFLIGKEKPSTVQLLVVLLICVGVVLATTGELQFSALGFTLQVSAILSDVCRMTLIDVLMVDIKLDSLSMLYYLAPVSSVLIGIGFLVFEYDHSAFPWERVFDPFSGLGAVLVLNGICAVSLNVVVFLAVGHTSSVIIGVCGLIKDMLLVVSSVLFLGSPITYQQIVGYSISIYGRTLYREFKADPTRFHNRCVDVWGRLRQVGMFVTSCCLSRGKKPGAYVEDESLLQLAD